MAGMLELLDWKFKTIMMITLRTPKKKKKKVENQPKQMSNVNRDIEILIKNKKY